MNKPFTINLLKKANQIRVKTPWFVCFLLFTQILLAQTTPKDSTRTALTTLFDTYVASKENPLQTLEKARALQQIGLKSEIQQLLDSIKPNVDFETIKRPAFLFLVVQSRNDLFHHQYANALKQAELALENSIHAKPDELIYLHSTIATSHYYTSSYDAALKSHFKALEICKKNEELKCLPGIFNNISVVYIGTGEWDKAQEYTQKALDWSIVDNNSFERSRAIGNMAIIYAEQGDFDTSEEWFLKDLNIYLASGDSISA